ncbi:MAG: hypothetical protein ACREJM_15700 [Candidatus Saccharimonadales bacterium]
MPEQAPYGEFDTRADELQWMLESWRFLAFRPDNTGNGPNVVGGVNQEAEVATYGIDGLSVMVVADYEGSTWEDLASVSITGAPQRDDEGRWFATETTYKIRSDVEDLAIRKPEDLEVKVEQELRYDDLDGLLLPGHYERIKEEYDAQRLARRDEVEGLAPHEVPSEDDVRRFREARLASLMELLHEGSSSQQLAEARLSDTLSEAAERALAKLDDGERLRPYAEALERRKADEMDREDESREIQTALGLDAVGDEELQALASRTARLRADPDAYLITSPT